MADTLRKVPEHPRVVDIKARIIAEIKAAMHQNGINQVELARRIGRTNANVSVTLSGRRSRLETLIRMCVELGINVTFYITHGGTRANKVL